MQALCTRAGKAKWLPHFVKIAAIGTLADVVPLVGENRVIARFGLDGLSRGPHTAGLRSLLDASGLTGKTIDSFHVAFMLAPRVNAAGRMSSPDLARGCSWQRARRWPRRRAIWRDSCPTRTRAGSRKKPSS